MFWTSEHQHPQPREENWKRVLPDGSVPLYNTPNSWSKSTTLTNNAVLECCRLDSMRTGVQPWRIRVLVNWNHNGRLTCYITYITYKRPVLTIQLTSVYMDIWNDKTLEVTADCSMTNIQRPEICGLTTFDNVSMHLTAVERETSTQKLPACWLDIKGRNWLGSGYQWSMDDWKQQQKSIANVFFQDVVPFIKREHSLYSEELETAKRENRHNCGYSLLHLRCRILLERRATAHKFIQGLDVEG